MKDEEIRRQTADFEERLRLGQPLSRDEQIRLLFAYLALSQTRRDLKYGQP